MRVFGKPSFVRKKQGTYQEHRRYGDIVTIVSVNGESRVKLFDDSKTYIHSVKADGTGGIIEYVATFPNMTVKNGDTYKACALTIKDSKLICETYKIFFHCS